MDPDAWIRIEVNSWIWIRIEIKSLIQIHIKVMRFRNPGLVRKEINPDPTSVPDTSMDLQAC